MRAVNEVHLQVTQILHRYVSESTARSMLQRALREARLYEATLRHRDLSRLLDRLGPAIRTYVTQARRHQLVQELDALRPQKARDPDQSIPVRVERDAQRARMLARSICLACGGKSLFAQKVATGVSELSRNILKYAGQGEVEISFVATPPRRVRVIASDKGPGIRDLKMILAGNYQSKTGLGRGLLGVKNMSDHFNIETSANGTKVEFEMHL